MEVDFEEETLSNNREYVLGRGFGVGATLCSSAHEPDQRSD